MKNPIGANTWIWVSPPTDERLAALAPRLSAWGFDQIEIPVEAPGDWDPARTAELLGNLGLAASVCAAMGPDRDFVSADTSDTSRRRRTTCATASTRSRRSAATSSPGRFTPRSGAPA